MEKRKFFFFGVLIGLGLLVAWLKTQPDGRLHLVFCDVGQGDAIYIKFPDGREGLIDGGPNRAVLNCLGKHMAFWDRKIELVVLTHPQADHLNGLIDVFERYQVDLFLAPPVGNETVGYKRLLDLVKEKGIRVRNVYQGDKINMQISKYTNKQINSKVALSVLWPEKEWLTSKLFSEKYIPTEVPIGSQIGMYNVLGAKSWHSDLNDFSLVLELKFGEFEALLTGDAGGEILERIIAGTTEILEILKVPHHGGVEAVVSTELLAKLKPALAVISVGKNNAYGHPREEILETLRRLDIKILRTDLDGEIEMVTDGRSWEVKK